METIETLSQLLVSFISPAKTAGMIVSGLIMVPLMILTALIIIAGISLAIFFVNKKLKDSSGRTVQEKIDPGGGSQFLKLRDGLEKISGKIPEIESQLDELRLDLEDYAAHSFKNEEELKEKYYGMADNLFLLLDHFEIYKKNHKKSDKIDWFHEKTRSILEQEGIEEIPVKRGDIFNGIYHRQMNLLPNKLPDGTILEVLSKGYYKKGGSENDDVILRPAGVTVSSGPQEDNISISKRRGGK